MYWVAINRNTATLCHYAMTEDWVKQHEGKICVPVPEWIVGFPTLEEAKEAQRILLKETISRITRKQKEWSKRKDVMRLEVKGSQPPASLTMWITEVL